ncbi:Uncharacterized protein GBIM_18829 [Gryllus bimaculatus]|nr:Uncharacterized protein GBIM_18829 [Gryllus bimaculatus]
MADDSDINDRGDGEAQKPEKMFTLKKWNAVAMWSWDVECDTCAICRVQVMALHGHRRRFDVRDGAHPPNLALEVLLDVLEAPALGFGHAEDNEEQADEADDAEHPEGAVPTQRFLEVVERLRDEEGARPVESGGERSSGATNLGCNRKSIRVDTCSE